MTTLTILSRCGDCGATFSVSQGIVDRLDEERLDEIARAAYAFHRVQCPSREPTDVGLAILDQP